MSDPAPARPDRIEFEHDRVQAALAFRHKKGEDGVMTQANILVIYTDGSAMIYAADWSLRIANRGPCLVRKKDYEQVSTHPPEWVGFGDFEARILTAGMRVGTHRGLLTVERVEDGVDAPAGDATAFLKARLA